MNDYSMAKQTQNQWHGNKNEWEIDDRADTPVFVDKSSNEYRTLINSHNHIENCSVMIMKWQTTLQTTFKDTCEAT